MTPFTTDKLLKCERAIKEGAIPNPETTGRVESKAADSEG